MNVQDEADEMTGEVKQLITNYNNIVSFTTYFCHNAIQTLSVDFVNVLLTLHICLLAMSNTTVYINTHTHTHLTALCPGLPR